MDDSPSDKIDARWQRATTSMLVYEDLGAAHDYLVRVFGLTAGPLHTTTLGIVVHGGVRAQQG